MTMIGSMIKGSGGRSFLIVALGVGLLVASCGPAVTPPPGARARAPEAQGQVSVYLSGPVDSPFQLTVTLTALEVQAEDGSWIKLMPGPVTLDSNALAGKRLILSESQVPRGRYHKIRLSVIQASVTREGERADLLFPKDGFEYLFNFQVFPGENTPIYLDWDAGRSVTAKINLDMVFKIRTKAKAVVSSLIYVTSEATGRVTVLDRASWQEVASIPVGDAPRGIVIGPARTQLYVANSRSDTISIIEGTNHRVLETVSLRAGDSPEALGLSQDGRELFVVNGGSNSVAVVDLPSRTVVARVPVGIRPMNIILDPLRRRAYVANNLSNEVSVIDTFSRDVIATIRVEARPFGLALDQNRGLLYVTNGVSNNLSVIDARSNRVVDSLNVGAGATGVAVDPLEQRIYVVKGDTGELLFFHPELKTTIRRSRLGSGPWNLVLVRAERKIYVVNRGSNTLSVIDQTTGRLLQSVPVGALPYGLALAEAVPE